MVKRIPKARQAQAQAGSNVVDIETRRTTPLGMTNKPGPKKREAPDLEGRAGAFGDRDESEAVVAVDPASKPYRPVINVQITGKMAELWLGIRSVQDMDNDELARMQFKDINGKFSGHPPRNLPAQLVSEIRRELVQRATAQFDGSLMDAIEALQKIATNTDYEPKDRLRAANLLIERSLGKVSETITVQGDAAKPIEILLTRVDRSGRPEPKVIEHQNLPPGTVRQVDVEDDD